METNKLAIPNFVARQPNQAVVSLFQYAHRFQTRTGGLCSLVHTAHSWDVRCTGYAASQGEAYGLAVGAIQQGLEHRRWYRHWVIERERSTLDPTNPDWDRYTTHAVYHGRRRWIEQLIVEFGGEVPVSPPIPQIVLPVREHNTAIVEELLRVILDYLCSNGLGKPHNILEVIRHRRDGLSFQLPHRNDILAASSFASALGHSVTSALTPHTTYRDWLLDRDPNATDDDVVIGTIDWVRSWFDQMAEL